MNDNTGPQIFKLGDRVTLSYRTLSTDAVVLLASNNGKFLALSFQVEGDYFVLPVMRKDDGVTYECATNSDIDGIRLHPHPELSAETKQAWDRQGQLGGAAGSHDQS